MSPGGQMFGLRVANLLPAFTHPFSQENIRIGLLSHGDLSPDTAAQLWPVHTAFPGSAGGKNCLSLDIQGWVVNRRL